MLEKMGEMERICLDSEKDGLSSENIIKLSGLNDIIHESFIRYYTLQEDILFPELEKVLPSPTSTTSMRNEHREIAEIIYKISSLIGEDSSTKDRSGIFSSVYSCSDILQRHFHKKNNVMYHEVSSFLSEDAQGEIYSKILLKQHTG
jgi:iron-sulfur cluster repair protein YtfE (RIC family)